MRDFGNDDDICFLCEVKENLCIQCYCDLSINDLFKQTSSAYSNYVGP